MRTRNFVDQSLTATYRSYWWDSHAGVAYDNLVTYNSARNYRSMQDVVTENFKRRQAEGEVILNAMYLEDLQSTYTPITFTRDGVYNNSTTVKGEGIIPYPNTTLDQPRGWNNFFVDLEPYESERDIAIAKAWANVDESELLALATLGELPETVSWIASIYRRAINIIRLFRKKAIKRSLARIAKDGKVLDSLQSFWLEFRYALRPLVFEMHQALAALKKKIKEKTRNTARGFNFHNSRSTSTSEEGENLVCRFSETVTSSHNYRAGVLYVIEDDINGILSVWGLNQPLDAVWELTPFSFIIDWFFNIGDIISSWSYNPNLSPLGSWVTEEHLILKQTICTFATTHVSSGLYEFDYTYTDFGNHTTRRVYKRRIPNPSRPILPSVKINLDFGKLIDLAAIGRQLFGSIKA